MAVQVYHAVKAKMLSILTGLVVEGSTQSCIFEYPYVMYNLPHSYMQITQVCMVPSAANDQEGVLVYQ